MSTHTLTDLWHQLSRRHGTFAALVAPGGAPAESDLAEIVDDWCGDMHRSHLVVECVSGDRALLDGQEHALDDSLADRLSLSSEREAVATVAGMENLSLEGQFQLLGAVRRIRDQHPPGSTRTIVFAGRWNASRFIREWKVRNHQVSPPLEGERVFYLPFASAEHIAEKLTDQIDRTPYLAALCEGLAALTGGDTQLLLELVDGPRVAAPVIEQRAWRLRERPEVEQIVRSRLAALPPAAAGKFESLLRYGALQLDWTDPDGEDLFLSGLVRFEERLPSRRYRLASPIVDAVIRRIRPTTTTGYKLVDATELAPVSHPTLVHASRLVSEIECALRNLVVSMLADGEGHPLQARARRNGEDLFAAATERRHQANIELDALLIESPVCTYLDVADLKKYICDETLHDSHFKQVFEKKPDFDVNFEKFSKLRNAVAHNKVCSIQLLHQLEDLREFFLGHIGKAAAREAMVVPSGELVDARVAEKTLRLVEGKLTLEINVTNKTTEIIEGIHIGVAVRSGGRWQALRTERPGSLSPLETLRMKVSGKWANSETTIDPDAVETRDLRVSARRHR